MSHMSCNCVLIFFFFGGSDIFVSICFRFPICGPIIFNLKSLFWYFLVHQLSSKLSPSSVQKYRQWMQLRSRDIPPSIHRQWTSKDPHGGPPGCAALPHLLPLPHLPQWVGEPCTAHDNRKCWGKWTEGRSLVTSRAFRAFSLVFAHGCLQFHGIDSTCCGGPCFEV